MAQNCSCFAGSFFCLLIFILIPFHLTEAAYSNTNNGLVINTPEKQKVINVLTSMSTGVVNPAAYTSNFIQHNLAIADGVSGLQAFLNSLNGSFPIVDTIRIFQDGNTVWAHSAYELFGLSQVVFDTFRFDNGLIAEHWDNLQVTPLVPNLSGHTMLDGAIQATNLNETEQNRALAVSFRDIVLVGNNLTAIPLFYGPGAPIQHDPRWADGVQGIANGLSALAAAGNAVNLTLHEQIFVEGSFILITSQGFFGPKPFVVYDMYRVDNDRLVEHWDNQEIIPPRSDWKNQNGKF